MPSTTAPNPRTTTPSPASAALNTPERKPAIRFIASATLPHCPPTWETYSQTLDRLEISQSPIPARNRAPWRIPSPIAWPRFAPPIEPTRFVNVSATSFTAGDR